METTNKVPGSKILDDRASIQAYVVSNNALFNKKITKIADKNFTKIKQLGIFQHSDDPNPHIFYFHASKYQSDDKEDVEDYIIQELHRFYNNFQCSYSVAYIHSSFVDFIVFRRFVQKWPEHFFRKLRKIYIVGASLMVKFIQAFSIGTFYRLCDQIFVNLSSINQLKLKDEALMITIGQNPKTPASTYKNSIKIIQNQLYGKTLQDYDLHTGKYPRIILRLLRRMLRNTTQLQLEGIFRKSCDSEQLQKLQKHLQAKNWGEIDNENNILTVCGCLKKILNNLRLPLFNYKIYSMIIDFAGGDEMQFIRLVIKQMEYQNKKVFILMLTFLTDYIVEQKQYNKMSGYNLSVVFGPCFFRPKEYDLKDLIYSGKFAKILVNCFDRQAELIEQGERNLAKSILKSLQQGDFDIEQQ